MSSLFLLLRQITRRHTNLQRNCIKFKSKAEEAEIDTKLISSSKLQTCQFTNHPIHTGPQADGGFFFVLSIPTMPKILYDP